MISDLSKEQMEAMLYRFAAMLRNAQQLPWSDWVANGADLLAELHDLDPEKYVALVKGGPDVMDMVEILEDWQNPEIKRGTIGIVMIKYPSVSAAEVAFGKTVALVPTSVLKVKPHAKTTTES